MPITKEGSQSEKATYCMIPNIWYSGNSKIYENSKKISGCYVFGSRECIEHGGFLGQWKYSIWCYNDGHMSLFICPNQRMQSTESEW